ncbi:MAG: dTMP kinase [Candidatus Omnitrophota bacterium]
MKGKFITFEGSEGCGKSTQSKLLYEYLKQKGYKAVYLREPGGVKVSEKIRNLLLDPKNKISPVTETLLYMAARAEVVNEVIIPALASGKIVVCDRFLDSTICYQGYGLGVDIKTIKFIGNFATSSIEPNLTIFLDLAVKKGLKHRHLQEDRIEQRPLTYHERVRKGYFKLANLHKKRIKIVKLELDIFLTQDKIRKLCHSIISKAKIK